MIVLPLIPESQKCDGKPLIRNNATPSTHSFFSIFLNYHSLAQPGQSGMDIEYHVVYINVTRR